MSSCILTCVNICIFLHGVDQRCPFRRPSSIIVIVRIMIATFISINVIVSIATIVLCHIKLYGLPSSQAQQVFFTELHLVVSYLLYNIVIVVIAHC